jgi:hypothetical protein
VMFKYGDSVSQGRSWSSPSCSSNHDWTVQLCAWGTVILKNCITVWKEHLIHGMYLITQPVHVLPYSNSAMKGKNGTNRILYHDITTPNHHRTSPCPTVGTRHSRL